MNYLVETAERIRRLVPPEVIPDDSDSLFLIYAVLTLAKGEATTTEDVHNAWTAWMLMRGEDHPSMRPFHELPNDIRIEDEPFARAIRAASAGHAKPGR